MADQAVMKAMTNRSLRTIRAELEFLADAEVIGRSQLDTILSQLPSEGAARNQTHNVASPTPAQPPVAAFNNLSVNNEKQSNGYYGATSPSPQPPAVAPPPPAYPQAPVAPPLCHASAMYAYNPTDAGDLALMPNDSVAVTEYMNAEWWKGRNERTQQEGIFPRSYVRVTEDKAAPQPSNYGNMPLDVASGAGQQQQPAAAGGVGGGKGAEMGKKFGKKLGNAAIFGAGATIGGNIVNSVF